MPRSISFDRNFSRLSTVLLLRFVRLVKEHLNMMLLQESEKVNKTLGIELQLKFV